MTTANHQPPENMAEEKEHSNTSDEAVDRAAHGSETGLPGWHRLSIRYDGIEIIGATVTCKRPENSEQMNALMRELIAISEAPSVPDPEVLGDRSPNKAISKL